MSKGISSVKLSLIIFICIIYAIIIYTDIQSPEHKISETQYRAPFQCNGANASNCHIFQVGFNKCGTRAMQLFLKENQMSSLHHWISNKEWHHNHTVSNPQLLSITMFNQYVNNISLLNNLINDYTYFGDFGVYLQEYQDHDIIFVNKSAVTYYKVLLEHFKYSLFILNIRNVYHWLRSRYLHYDRLKMLYQHGYIYYDKIYIDKIKMIAGIDIYSIYDKYSDFRLLHQWKILWYQYLCDIIGYFKKMNLMNRIIIFDIEKDNITKLISFFDSYRIVLDANVWKSRGKTNYSTSYQIHGIMKWNDFVQQYPEFAIDDIDNYFEIDTIKRLCHLHNI